MLWVLCRVLCIFHLYLFMFVLRMSYSLSPSPSSSYCSTAWYIFLLYLYTVGNLDFCWLGGFFLSFYFLAGIRNPHSKSYLGGFLFVSCPFLVWSVGFGSGWFGFRLYFNDENKIKMVVIIHSCSLSIICLLW